MPRVILGVTGSVAAIKTPELYRRLRASGHDVRLVVTEPALHFFAPEELGPGAVLHRDADEWPVGGWRRGDPVLHIELRNWAEILIVAPMDAHTLGKFALGLCDNLLTCLLRAWDFSRPIVLAPAMNTLMWRNPVTVRQFRRLLEDHGDGVDPGPWSLDDVAEVFAAHAPRIVVIPPQSKRLACGDVGLGAMAELVSIAESVRRLTNQVEIP